MMNATNKELISAYLLQETEHQYPPRKRGLLKTGRAYKGQLGYRTSTGSRKVRVITPTEHVKIRKRVLRGLITDYVAIADRAGLDAANVARLYRQRADNGYTVSTRDVELVQSETWNSK